MTRRGVGGDVTAGQPPAGVQITGNLTADANASLDAQQEINLALFRRFGEEGIAFAYPTQTLIVQGQAEQFPGAAPAAEAAG